MKGPLAKWQTWAIIGLVAVLAYVLVAQPFRDKGSAYVDISLLGANGETLQIIPGKEYTFNVVNPLTLTHNGTEFHQFEVEMGVHPVGTNIPGSVAITGQYISFWGVYQGAVFAQWESPEGEISKAVPMNTKSKVYSYAETIGNIFTFYNKGTGDYVYGVDFWGTGTATDKTGETLSADFSAMGSVVFHYTEETGTLNITSYVDTSVLELTK